MKLQFGGWAHTALKQKRRKLLGTEDNINL